MRALAISICSLLLCSTVHAATPNRTEFAQKLAKLKPGMTADQVKKLLGPPDDIVTEKDPGGITAARTVEVWRYGARGHLAFGTLGTVHVQADRKVQYVFGGAGTPFTQLPEPELRRLLELIDAVPSYNEVLEPLALVRAVNALHPLGKDRALDVIDEYLRVSSPLDDSGREGVFLLLRTLFDAKTFPPMMVGAPTLAPPSDPKALPRFPIVIVGDVPLKLVGGYMLGGKPEDPEDDVAAFRKLGTLRKAPLQPAAGALDAIDAFVENRLAKLVKVDDGLRVMIYDQALRCFGTVHRPKDIVDGWFPFGRDVAMRWKTVRAEIAKLGAKWSAANQELELPGGKTLPPRPPGFQRVWWDIGIAGTTKSRLTLERISDRLVLAELRLELVKGAKVKADVVRFVDAGTSQEIARLELQDIAAPSTSTAGSVTSRRIELPRGRAVTIELVAASKGTTLTP